MGDIFDIIRDKALQQEDAVPADAWDNIRRRRKKRPGGLIWLAAAMLTGLMIGGTFLYVNLRNSQPGRHAISESPAVSPNEYLVDRSGGNDDQSDQTTNTAQSITPDKKPAKQKETTPAFDQEYSDLSDNKVSSAVTVHTDINRTGKPLMNKPDQSSLRQGNKNNHTYTSNRKKRRKYQGNQQISISSAEPENAEMNIPGDNQADKKVTDARAVVTTESPVIAGVSEPGDNQKGASGTEPVVKEKTKETSPEKNIVNTVNGNEKKSQNSKKKGWHLDFSASPAIAVSQYDHNIYYTRRLNVQNGKSEFSGKLDKSYINPSVALMLGLRKSVSKKLSIGVGLQYLGMKEVVRIRGTQTNTMFVISEPHVNHDDDPQFTVDTTTSVLTRSGYFYASNHYRFISVPVYLQYGLFSSGRWKGSLETGLTIHVSSAYSNELNKMAPAMNSTYAGGKQTDIGYAVNAGFRMERLLPGGHSFFATPFISVSPMLQQIKNTVTDKRIHRAGMQIGYTRSF